MRGGESLAEEGQEKGWATMINVRRSTAGRLGGGGEDGGKEAGKWLVDRRPRERDVRKDSIALMQLCYPRELAAVRRPSCCCGRRESLGAQVSRSTGV